MEKVIQHSIGQIVYKESYWTGQKQILINGKPLKKLGKTLFEYVNEEGVATKVYIIGSFTNGVKLSVGGETIQVTPPTKWYEYVLAIIIPVFVIIWGSSPELCTIFPVIGGAIGGAIAGFAAFSALVLMKSTTKPLYKILIGLGMFVAAVLVCFILALALISALV